MDTAVNRLLIISPFFVPMNYVGAKRTLHYCRHLPPLGWAPAVVALPEDLERDPALASLVPDVPLYRGYRGGPVAWGEDLLARLRPPRPGGPPHAKTTAAPERKDGWLPALTTATDKYTRYLPWVLAGTVAFALKERVRAVYVSAGPYSGLELGHLVARALRLPLVVDLRDPWSIERNFQAQRTPRGQRLVEARERQIFGRADAIILNTESALDAYREAYAGAPAAARMSCIRNAFDPELYCAPAPAPSPDDRGPFRIGYYGHLRANKDAVQFLEALSRFAAERGLGPGDLELLTFGERTAADEEAIARFGLAGAVVSHPWVPFTECPAVLGRCHVLLDLMGPRHGLQISGKLYDYFACRRWVLAVSPNREVGTILEETGAGLRVDNGVDPTVAALHDLYERRGRPPELTAAGLEPYTARRATQRLASILEEVLRCRS
jgi:hypothetical protein